MKREKCIVCGYPRVTKIIDLGMHAFADTFVPSSAFYKPDMAYPLACTLCERCGHVQAVAVTDPVERYQNDECGYSYTSSNSATSRKHWEEFANDVVEETALPAGSHIIEAGSNDGYLLHVLESNHDMNVLGIDPSHSVAALAAERNICTVIGLFEDCAHEVFTETGVDMVVANNVLNHSNAPVDFVRAANCALVEKGWFVGEVLDWGAMIDSGRFDQIYHEHVSYFTVQSLTTLLHAAGFTNVRVRKLPYHGGSIRFFAQKSNALDGVEVCQFIEEEKRKGLFNVDTYIQWSAAVRKRADDFLVKLHRLRESGFRVVAVGAAAKGNTFLTYHGLNNHTVDFITDASREKQGKYTPLTRIPIVGDGILGQYKDRLVLVYLAWNIPEIVVKNVMDQIDEKCEVINLQW